jgi:hypothetical protein
VAKPVERAFRSLRGLEKTGSTSRMLNLAALGVKHAADPEHRKAPFFIAPALNGAVILKHRLRPLEMSALQRSRLTATKLIIPFERTDLGLGGRSFLVGEDHWEAKLEAVRGDVDQLSRDVAILEALDDLPSLDPFLLREHLKRRGFSVSATHFDISAGDLDRMQRFVGGEIARLIALAYPGGASSEGGANRLVQALLGATFDERLEPLRLTLRLEGESYREGIFAWKGFLYYKWALNSLWPDLKTTIEQVSRVRISDMPDPLMVTEINILRKSVTHHMQRQVRMVMAYLKKYDDVFEQLTGQGNAIAFRDFLLESPEMFLALGEGCGAVSHMTSYWRYRFPPMQPLQAAGADLLAILQDFDAALRAETGHSAGAGSDTEPSSPFSADAA